MKKIFWLFFILLTACTHRGELTLAEIEQRGPYKKVQSDSLYSEIEIDGYVDDIGLVFTIRDRHRTAYALLYRTKLTEAGGWGDWIVIDTWNPASYIHRETVRYFLEYGLSTFLQLHILYVDGMSNTYTVERKE